MRLPRYPVPGRRLLAAHEPDKRDHRRPREETDGIRQNQHTHVAAKCRHRAGTPRKPVERDLTRERPPIERTADQKAICREGGGEQERQDETQSFVRHGLQPEAIPPRHEQPAFARKELEVSGECSDLACKLVASGRRKSMVRDRFWLEGDPQSSLRHPHRDQHVLDDRIGGNGADRPAADGGNGARDANR